MRVTTSEGHSVARIYTPLMQTYLVAVKEEGEGEGEGEREGEREEGDGGGGGG